MKHGIDIWSGLDVGRDRNSVDSDATVEQVCRLWAAALSAPHTEAAPPNQPGTTRGSEKDAEVSSSDVEGDDEEDAASDSTDSDEDWSGIDAVSVAATRKRRLTTKSATSKHVAIESKPLHPSPRVAMLAMLEAAQPGIQPFDEVSCVTNEHIFSKDACEGIAEEYNLQYGKDTHACRREEHKKFGNANVALLLPENQRKERTETDLLCDVLSRASRPTLEDEIIN
jgi:hypothetical protein